MKIQSANALLRFPAPSLTPDTSPAQSPESRAVEDLQAHLRGDYDVSLGTLFVLFNGLWTLYDEGVITEKLAKSLARDICGKYSHAKGW